jgi:hypothetical protein
VNVFDRLKLWRLKGLPRTERSVQGTHLGVAKSVVLLYKHDSPEKSARMLEWSRKLKEAGGPGLQVTPLAYWVRSKEERDAGKKQVAQAAHTPFDRLPQPWLHFNETAVSSWRKPKSVELRRFINTDFDLLIFCETAPCWVLEEILARSKAQMKMGPSGLVRSKDLDIILSNPSTPTVEAHLQATFDFLTNAPLQSQQPQ